MIFKVPIPKVEAFLTIERTRHVNLEIQIPHPRLGFVGVEKRSRLGTMTDGKICCAQQTGMHEMVVEALLVALYSLYHRPFDSSLIRNRTRCRSDQFRKSRDKA
jgi:hypothetical protein